MRRAFIVVGPESSGTKLLTRILIGMGCWGDDGDAQRLDKGFPSEGIDCIVWRRSFPCLKQWPILSKIFRNLLNTGFDKVTCFVTSRDWTAMASSQVKRGHVATIKQAEINIQRAYLDIFRALDMWCGNPFEIVNYEALVARPYEFCQALAQAHELEMTTASGEMAIHDGNRKHYG